MAHGVLATRGTGSQAREQGQRIQIDGIGAVPKGALELDADEVVGQKLKVVIGDGRSQTVLDEGLDLRSNAGASVIAIAAPAMTSPRPPGASVLAAGDVLSPTGTSEAVAAAVTLLLGHDPPRSCR